MWTETYHRFTDEAAFLAVCIAARGDGAPGAAGCAPLDAASGDEAAG